MISVIVNNLEFRFRVFIMNFYLLKNLILICIKMLEPIYLDINVLDGNID